MRGAIDEAQRTGSFLDEGIEFVAGYDLVMDAQAAGLAAVRPGVTAAEVHHACRDVIVAAGYGDFFRHRTGHCIGLDVHEYPYISEEDNNALRRFVDGEAPTIDTYPWETTVARDLLARIGFDRLLVILGLQDSAPDSEDESVRTPSRLAGQIVFVGIMLFAVNMALTAENGWVFSADDLEEWLTAACFINFECHPLPPPMPHWLATAVRATD